VRAERAQRVVARHFVFVLGAAITAFEPPQLLQIQRGEAAALDAAEVAAAALHPENGLLAAVHGIWLDDLGAGVAAAEVGNTQVAPQQVRAIAEKIGLIEIANDAVVPEVPEIAELGDGSHSTSGVRFQVPGARFQVPGPDLQIPGSSIRGWTLAEDPV